MKCSENLPGNGEVLLRLDTQLFQNAFCGSFCYFPMPWHRCYLAKPYPDIVLASMSQQFGAAFCEYLPQFCGFHFTSCCLFPYF